MPLNGGDRIALVGGSGMIGRRLAMDLEAAGADVVVLDRRPSASGRWLACDVGEPGLGGIPMQEFDTVIHLAALLGKGCVEDPDEGWRTNVTGTLQLIESLRQVRRPFRFVFMSSATVYAGDAGSPVGEDAPLSPRGLYGRSKALAEQAVAAAAETMGWDALILRPFTIYGPGGAGERGHFISSWLEKASAGAPLPVHGDGSQLVDLLHVADLSALCRAALAQPIVPARVRWLNAGSGKGTSVLDLADLFRRAVPGLTVERLGTAPGSGLVADVTGARQQLGWRPSIGVEEGLDALLREALLDVA